MGRWTIYNEDLSAMPTGRTFFVTVAPAPAYGMAGLWPRYDESPTSIEGDREVQFMHVYADPLAGGSGSYFTPFTSGYWDYTCHPLYGCVDRTIPGSASGPASTSFRFNRWVTVDAVW